ncbi:Glycoprotein-N-acetylgalactosamine 3-beta-galactosyltransferase 1 [Schistosoma japonicum]|nr:Glycoprotein-N-acetylgalactosamine 3-beta-galactosyltransferase 1 [Schistosoma japonicum]
MKFYSPIPMIIKKLGALNWLVYTLSMLRLNDVKLFSVGLGVTLLLKWFANFSGTPEVKCLSDGTLVHTEKCSLFSLTDVGYSEYLAKKINIYCYILTEPQEHFSRAYHVQTTWARRCTRYSFVSFKEEKLIKMLAVKRSQKYIKNSWISMRETLRALHNQTYKAPYFLKADDATYVIMENLRNALEYTNPRIPFIMGHVYEVSPNEFTLSGSFGYVMSKAALELIVLKGLDQLTECGPIKNVREDVQIFNLKSSHPYGVPSRG